MKELFINITEALELKELNFNEECIAEFFNGRLTFYKNLDESFLVSENDAECVLLMTYNNDKPNHFDKDKTICCPIYSQAFKWFREKYELFSSVSKSSNSNFNYFIQDIKGNENNCSILTYTTYEEAELELLKELIKIIKNK